MNIIKIGGIKIQEETLGSAVWKAHSLGWASGAQYCISESGVKWLKLVIVPEDVPHNPEQFTFLYVDNYSGELRFVGFECLSVMLPDESWLPIWGTTYRATCSPEEPKRIYAFLRKALSASIPLSNPFTPRGPSRFQDGDFHYRCGLFRPYHTILDFSGCERIAREGSTVYILEFKGGTIY